MTFRHAAPFALALMLAACGGPPPEQFPPVCPAVAPLPTAQDLVLYRPGGDHDLRDVQIQGSILSASGSCTDGVRGKTVNATLRLNMQFQRGPAAPTRQANVRYFVGVAQGESILNKQIFVAAVVFPPNVDSVAVSTPPVQITLPVGADRSAAAFTLWVGFQR
ncbi:MAG TPA: hypothetical protein VFA03_05175 [Acetobacteraceae bacterium]|nr:hypothetical protein [Acetobacteraceae bacterium]